MRCLNEELSTYHQSITSYYQEELYNMYANLSNR